MSDRAAPGEPSLPKPDRVLVEKVRNRANAVPWGACAAGRVSEERWSGYAVPCSQGHGRWSTRLSRAPRLSAVSSVAGERAVKLASSAHTVAGNGRPLSCALSADAVAGGMGRRR